MSDQVLAITLLPAEKNALSHCAFYTVPCHNPRGSPDSSIFAVSGGGGAAFLYLHFFTKKAFLGIGYWNFYTKRAILLRAYPF
jgi:hypothetical protein